MAGWFEGHRRRFLKQLGLAVLTLGLYMPVWLARRDAELREHLPEPPGIAAAWALGAGVAVSVIARAVFGGTSPDLAAALSLVGLLVFLLGFHRFAQTLADACEAAGKQATAPPLPSTAILGLAFLGVEIGGTVETWFVRGPAIALILTLPYVFWHLHLGVEAVRETDTTSSGGREPERPAAGSPTS